MNIATVIVFIFLVILIALIVRQFGVFSVSENMTNSSGSLMDTQ